jgi:hypothetical protein
MYLDIERIVYFILLFYLTFAELRAVAHDRAVVKVGPVLAPSAEAAPPRPQQEQQQDAPEDEGKTSYYVYLAMLSYVK